MDNICDIKIISGILKIFKVKRVVISGILDLNLFNNIKDYDAILTQVNTGFNGCIKGNPLKTLPSLKNYDAIFINDDSNWYTIFNELNIIKETNDEFPLVFICNNNFPNKRRDAYINPKNIPSEFRQKYTNKLSFFHNNEKVTITDGVYHACDENTPKNGVFTAIEDFLKENSYIGMLKLNFIKEIYMLYPKLQINQKRLSRVYKLISNAEINDFNLSDKLIENQILISYINKYELYDDDLIDYDTEISKKNSIIHDYENKIRLQNNELNLKDAKLCGIESNLNLKDSQIKNFESKLFNKNKIINKLENQLHNANDNIYSLNQETKVNNEKVVSLENQLKNTYDDLNSINNQLNSLNKIINQKDDYLKNNHEQIKIKNEEINSLKNDLTQKERVFRNKENELNFQININSENIKQRDNQIKLLENDLTQKERVFRNKENELKNQININNDTISHKNDQIMIQQKELEDKKRKINDLEYIYTKQLSKIDNTEYCIHCFKEEISNNYSEIRYLKMNNFVKKIFSPLAYIYLILKSSPKEWVLNIKLYQALKNSKCFDIGFYLNKNNDLAESKWCKYFSPELHYVCHGFDEKRKFNKKYYVKNSKKALLDYLFKYDG